MKKEYVFGLIVLAFIRFSISNDPSITQFLIFLCLSAFSMAYLVLANTTERREILTQLTMIKEELQVVREDIKLSIDTAKEAKDIANKSTIVAHFKK